MSLHTADDDTMTWETLSVIPAFGEYLKGGGTLGAARHRR